MAYYLSEMSLGMIQKSLYSVQLRYTYTICFVLLGKIPLHVSGWLAHHQEVCTCTVHTANWSSLSSMLSSRPLGMD